MSDNTFFGVQTLLALGAVLAFSFMAFEKGCASQQSARNAETERLRQRAAAPLVETCVTHSVLDRVEVH